MPVTIIIWHIFDKITIHMIGVKNDVGAFKSLSFHALYLTESVIISRPAASLDDLCAM